MDIQNIISRFSKLSTKEKTHVFKILISEGVKYSKNLNGYFFNLGSADDSIILKIKYCLELIEPNREIITQLDTYREELRQKYSNIIREKLVLRNLTKLRDYEDKIILRHYSNVNIEFEKTKQYQIREREDLDIDEKIKRYRKRLNFSKNTAYYRLLQKTKKKSNSSKDNLTYDNDNYIMSDEYPPNEIADEEIDDFEDVPNDDIFELDEDNDKEEELDNETDDNFIEDNENDYDHDHEHENENKEQKEERNEELKEQILYYRKILNQHGFQFDENKYCKLVYQDYIMKI